jgi:hypothetical protein
VQGFQGEDVLQLGEYFAFSKFGSITDCNSPGAQAKKSAHVPLPLSLLAPLAPLAPHSLHLLSTADFNGVDGIIGFGLPVAHAPAQPPAPPASMFGGMQVFLTEFSQQTTRL